MSEIGAGAIVIVIAAIPISFIIRCATALFSRTSRENISASPVIHIVWFLLAVVAVTYFMVGYTLTRRKAKDHQQRIAEQGVPGYRREVAPQPER